MTQRKVFTSLFVLMLSCVNVINIYGDEKDINLQHMGNHGDHMDYITFDRPDFYYDQDNGQIIIDGYGEVNYYDVEIRSISTGNVFITTRVSGDYDSIDVSSLPTDKYLVIIITPSGNEFMVFFGITRGSGNSNKRN